MIKTAAERTNGNTKLAKVKRIVTSVLPVAKNRKGTCMGCGSCCKLPNVCPFLRTNGEGDCHCAIYPLRPLNCRKYPRAESEFLTADRCGFRFEQPESKTKIKV